MNERLDQNISIGSSQGAAGREHRLIFIRTIWWIAALLAFGFIAVGVPDRYAQLSTVSPGANTLVGQLRPDQAYALEQAGISVTFYAVYFTALDTLVTLLFVSTGLVIVWFRPEDRAALLLSLFLIGMGLTAIAVGMTHPRWHPAIIAVRVVWYASSMPALYLFPDGRFVPRWTRWLTAIWLIYTVVWLIFPAISPPFGFSQGFTGSELPRNLWILLWIGSGLAAQIYRYRQVSNAMERQQMKWVEYGFWSFVILWAIGAGIITLTQLAPMEGAVMIAKLAGTSIALLGTLTIPLSLGASILRYRLFDIDVVINRTLVYGTLTACVAGLYILIVGGAGLVMQTNTNLAGLLVTALLVGAIYRPMRSLLQTGVDRLLHGTRGAVSNGSVHSLSEVVEDRVEMHERPDPADAVGVPPATLWMRVARLAWYPTFAIALWIFLPEFFNRAPGIIASIRYSVNPLAWIGSGLLLLAGLVSLLLALLIFWHRSGDRMGLFTSFFLLMYGITNSGTLETLKPIFPIISRYTEITLPGFVAVLTLILFAVFPDGRFVPPWTRWVVWAAFLTILLLMIRSSLYSPSPIEFSPLGDLIFTVLIFVLVMVGWISIFYAQVYRYRYISTPQQRQQTKWAVYGMSISFGIQMFLAIPWIFSYVLPSGFPFPSWQDISSTLYSLGIGIPILPVTLTIAVMRYRLYDIDIIINRTLVYGALTAIVVAIYVLIVGIVGTLLHTQGNILITLLATGLIAVLFHPLRERLQRGVNRLLYGERDDPIEALSRLGKQMEIALPSDQVLPSLVKTIAQTLKLPFVGITLKGQRDISFGQETENPVAFPFIFQGETTGVLLASPRNPGDKFTPGEMRLLQNLARQAGAAVRNAQLTADLQRSRQTLVTAREEERHRLRRDLHDGIGPTMAGLTLKLDAAKDLVSSGLESGKKKELEDAVQLLSELKTQTQETVQSIRHIVHTLRPPSLDVLGLVPALQAHFGQVGTPRNMNIQMTTTPENFPRLSAAVEVAAYHIILEAVTNVIQHARAESCEVSLALENGNLKMEIKDDGVGLSKARTHGIGLDSMRERAEELGGRFELSSSPQGTHVCAEIPIAPARKES